MNFGDCIRRSNSWHWLATVAVLSAVGSVFLPTYGWKDALAFRRTLLEPRVRHAQTTLDGLKALDEMEALAADKATADVKARTEKLRRDFAAYGLDSIPVGDEAVFAAQSRISEALSRHRIRIVSNDAHAAKAVPRSTRPSVAPQFRTSEIGYVVTGDFRDMFLFLVGETHRKSNEAFRDIVVRRGEDGGMDVSFTLRVMHK